jgi:hypothetical protein
MTEEFVLKRRSPSERLEYLLKHGYTIKIFGGKTGKGDFLKLQAISKEGIVFEEHEAETLAKLFQEAKLGVLWGA